MCEFEDYRRPPFPTYTTTLTTTTTTAYTTTATTTAKTYATSTINPRIIGKLMTSTTTEILIYSKTKPIWTHIFPMTLFRIYCRCSI